MDQGKDNIQSATTRDPKSARIEAWLLYAVVFLCGAGLMALEFTGIRVIAPYFGWRITWGSLIGVFTIALSLGYVGSGYAVDRWPRLSVLAGIVVFAGLFILLVPLLSTPVGRWLVDGSQLWGAFFFGMILFVVPFVLLGTVSPFSVRLSTREFGRVGDEPSIPCLLAGAGGFALSCGPAIGSGRESGAGDGNGG